ncbi:MAG: hypothetical protein IT384_04065 [Deltaproteobacteria bacterium]|nr:hypothetical protein [Deltaproteobacteria bacterium]
MRRTSFGRSLDKAPSACRLARGSLVALIALAGCQLGNDPSQCDVNLPDPGDQKPIVCPKTGDEAAPECGANCDGGGAPIEVPGTRSPPLQLHVPDQFLTTGAPYRLALADYTVPTDGDPITGYALPSGALPPELSLETDTGVISGIPLAPGEATTRWSASDRDGTSVDVETIGFWVREPNAAPEILSFQAIPGSVEQGVATRIRWIWSYATPPVPSATCEITPGVGPITSGASTIQTIVVPTPYTLTCHNSIGSGTSQIVVAIGAASGDSGWMTGTWRPPGTSNTWVVDQSGPAGAGGNTAVPGCVNQVPFSYNCPAVYQGPTGGAITMTQGNVVAVRYRTGPSITAGWLTVTGGQGSGTGISASLRISFSQLPGDESGAVPVECTARASAGGFPRILIAPTSGCIVLPNTIYYLSLSTTSPCSGGGCRFGVVEPASVAD